MRGSGRAGHLKFLAADLWRFPDGEPVLRHAWLAEALPGTTFQPVFAEEVAAVRFVIRAKFDALYDAGQIRRHHTRLFCEEALRQRQRAEAAASAV